MKKEEFELQIVSLIVNDKKIYKNIESAKKRIEILKDFDDGKITKDEFKEIQKKISGGKYLKDLYSEQEYLKAIKEGL